VLLRGGLEWPIRHRSVPWHSGIRVVLTSLGIQSVLQKKVQLLNLRRVDLDRVFEHSPMHALNAGRFDHCAFVLVIILSRETIVRVCHHDWDKWVVVHTSVLALMYQSYGWQARFENGGLKVHMVGLNVSFWK
jgi:hypothetical protein